MSSNLQLLAGRVLLSIIFIMSGFGRAPFFDAPAGRNKEGISCAALTASC